MQEGIGLAVVGALIFLSYYFTRLFNRTGIPDIFFLLVLGLLIGPVFHLLKAADFGIMGPALTSITLILIMFQGGLDLKLDVLRRSLRHTLMLTLATFVLSTVAVGFVTPYVDGVTLPQTFILGAIVAPVSPSVVVPMIRQMRMASESKAILAVESALSDAISITVTIALLEALSIDGAPTGKMAGRFVASFAVAIAAGVGGGLFWSRALERVRAAQNSLFLTVAFALVVFGVVQWLGFAGYIAALAFGITLGNIGFFNRGDARQLVARDFVALSETEKAFFSEFAFLLKTFFFVYIGISIRLDQPHLLLTGFLLSLMILLLRLPIVGLTVERSAPAQDASSMAVMVPKGLATAVLASLPLHWGTPGGAQIQGIAYSVILSSIAITSAMILLLARTKIVRLFDRLFPGFRR